MITLEKILNYLEPRVTGLKRRYYKTSSNYVYMITIDNSDFEMGIYINDRFGFIDNGVYFALINYFEKKFVINAFKEK